MNGNKNKNAEAMFSSEGEAEFFHETQDSRGQDVYEVEWDLNLVPKHAPNATYKPDIESAKKDRK